jgi:hypothetical protein
VWKGSEELSQLVRQALLGPSNAGGVDRPAPKIPPFNCRPSHVHFAPPFSTSPSQSQPYLSSYITGSSTLDSGALTFTPGFRRKSYGLCWARRERGVSEGLRLTLCFAFNLLLIYLNVPSQAGYCVWIDKGVVIPYKSLLRQYLSGRNSAVECQLPKLDVVGSIPIARSKSFPKYCRIYTGL